MKKIFAIFGALALLVSCNKDNKTDNGSIIDDGGNGGTTELHQSLKGSNYYPILMDQTTFDKIASKVAADLRCQDGGDAASTRPMYIWNGYAGNTASGLSFYGGADGFTSLVVNDQNPEVGSRWSGQGIFVKKTDPGFDKIKEIGAGYYFHFAYKGAAGVSHCVYPTWGGKEYRVSIGEGEKFVDQGNAYDFIAPISNGGKFVANEWNEYEIAISDTGINFAAEANEAAGNNIFCSLSGGVNGTVLNLDAVFFYKK